jgi:hypothetical protein
MAIEDLDCGDRLSLAAQLEVRSQRPQPFLNYHLVPPWVPRTHPCLRAPLGWVARRCRGRLGTLIEEAQGPYAPELEGEVELRVDVIRRLWMRRRTSVVGAVRGMVTAAAAELQHDRLLTDWAGRARSRSGWGVGPAADIHDLAGVPHPLQHPVVPTQHRGWSRVFGHSPPTVANESILK